ncbi:ATP-binding cassette domain-containing protein [Bizionia paragorgiae]|uniref:Putative ABC transport system ATP-binding protein n=1 Tax=Bizionia paragorgiae TaxID=283786 RepID=A0A1H3X1J0_BIZPA|nr:ATP-binding cassette domain-containing protein [Bizionia paragorgiae]SDZ93257.1 putative ABC transport system ATP-binding protein [Bizionia paragorgiae]
MSEIEVSNSDIYMQPNVVFSHGKNYLIKANSGHGKTSILNFIYGSSTNYQGRISYNSKTEINVLRLRKEKLSYVFQDFKLFSSLSVYQNIVLKNNLTHHKTQDEIDAFINQLGLEHKRDSLVENLSLGQKQRVAIIRALCQPFQFILLDEPFSHLDPTNIKIASALIQNEAMQQNAGILMTALDMVHVFNFNATINL